MTTAAGEDGGGVVEARKHGYRPMTLGKRQCRDCKFATEKERREAVRCTMFDFWAAARGSCDEWAPE